MKNIIQADREDINSILEEEQYNFVRLTLLKIDLPELKNCLPEAVAEFTVVYKIELRQILSKFKLDIRQLPGEELRLFVEQEVIAIWKKPEIRWRSEGKKNLFVEIVLDTWSVFDAQDIF